MSDILSKAVPSTKRQDLVEEIHGHKVADPYRWLEDSDDPEVKAWVDAQNRRTREVLDSIDGRREIRDRFSELVAVRATGLPVRRGGSLFFTRREPEQNQGVLFVREAGAAAPRVLVDPNLLRADGTASLDWWYPSRDGKLLAFGISESGNERSTLHLLEVATGKRLPDTIPHARHSSVSWEPGGKAFYYTRNPAPGDVAPGDEAYYSRVFHHVIGTDPSRDALVFGEGRDKTDIPSVALSPDGRILLVTSHLSGAERSDVFVKVIGKDDAFRPVIAGEAALSTGRPMDDAVYLRTNLDAPNYRLFRIDPANVSRDKWVEVVAQGDRVLEGFSCVGGKLVVQFMRSAMAMLCVHGPDGVHERDVELPGPGSVGGVSGEPGSDEFFFAFTGFQYPLSIYRSSVESPSTELFEKMEVPFDPRDFEVEQVWYESRDGTKVSMFVGRKKGLEKTGDAPVLLTGYGGFNIPLTPYFSAMFLVWMERGGLFGVPNLRGGSEYGEEWHRAGMLGRKQNVFDDFHAAGEWFVNQGWSKPEKMVAWGGSNGGLLVGAALTQRPDLFRTIVCDVPVIDMVRYHRFLLARYWMGEYGDPDNPEHLGFLLEYSPYHNVKQGADYPAVFVGTAEADARVDPMHARKFAALLQASSSSGRPVLFWEERRAGHGISTPVKMRIEEIADRMTFVLICMGGL